MTLYEVGDLINSTSSNIIAAQAIFFTTITAYLVVAYSVGKSLTTYQVAFINVAFLIGMATGVMGVVANASLIAEYNSIRQGLVGQRVPEVLDTAWVITFTAVRAVLIFGALVFMWQVRHPRTE
mgnify:CR=1 FL=1